MSLFVSSLRKRIFAGWARLEGKPARDAVNQSCAFSRRGFTWIVWKFRSASHVSTMDVLPSGNLFRELQDVTDTGYFEWKLSLEDYWQQVSDAARWLYHFGMHWKRTSWRIILFNNFWDLNVGRRRACVKLRGRFSTNLQPKPTIFLTPVETWQCPKSFLKFPYRKSRGLAAVRCTTPRVYYAGTCLRHN